MQRDIYRKKSMERVGSPEQLNDYIKVCNPSMWVVLVSIILLLAGAVVWGIFGRLDTTVDTVAVAQGSHITVYVKEADIQSVMGKRVTVNEAEYTITQSMCSSEPIAVGRAVTDYALYIGGLKRGEWVYTIVIEDQLPKGVYEAKIVTQSVSPMSLIIVN